MPTISIFRPNAYYGKLKSWNIKIDDEKVDKIKREERKVLQVPVGTHIVQINTGMGGSNSNKLKITIDTNQTVNLNIEIHYSFWWGMLFPLYSVLNRNKFIKLVPEY